MESYRRAYGQGRKKTAENVHRARNRVTRPEIAESMNTLRNLNSLENILPISKKTMFLFGMNGQIKMAIWVRFMVNNGGVGKVLMGWY